MAYTSQFTGAQIDAAVSNALEQKKIVAVDVSEYFDVDSSSYAGSTLGFLDNILPGLIESKAENGFNTFLVFGDMNLGGGDHTVVCFLVFAYVDFSQSPSVLWIRSINIIGDDLGGSSTTYISAYASSEGSGMYGSGYGSITTFGESD